MGRHYYEFRTGTGGTSSLVSLKSLSRVDIHKHNPIRFAGAFLFSPRPSDDG
jgi:hypothetical protein